MNIDELLINLSYINIDNGKHFTDTRRLDAINELLWNSNYRRINAQGLFHLYSKLPLSKLKSTSIVVVSTHVDCHENITECFSKIVDDEMILGTYDNMITNAAVISNMLSDNLPDKVLVAFTGDEENNSKGAKKLIKFLRDNIIDVKCVVVLDVTDMGWEDKADFTIENNFRLKYIGEKVIHTADKFSDKWRFVPSDSTRIPGYVNLNRVIKQEAEQDETWEYDEQKQSCFSLCLPVKGHMHSNEGVYARKISLEKYASFMAIMLNEIC